MRRRGRRLAQATLRGMLLCGGVIATWGAYDAVMDDPAYAVDEPRRGMVGDLLDGAGAVVDTVVSRPPASPGGSATVDRGPAGTAVVREPAPATAGTAGIRASARAERDPGLRVPPGDLSAAVAPVRRVVDRAAGTGLAEAVAPVTRPVVGAAATVVQETVGTGLLEPVDAVVRPVAEPVVETLAPVIAPVLGATPPILGQPADLVVLPGDPVEPQPAPSGAVPVTSTPDTTEHSVRAAAVTPAHPEAAPSAPCWNVTAERWCGGEPAAGAAADVSRGFGRVGGTGSGGPTPISSGSAASSASSGAGTATVADISPHPRTLELVSQRCASSRCDTFAQRSPQPGTRPG
ncbi:hypothetical protein [Micromonospora sp. NPDC005087]|uniref:hypothetical protein n=1 Tax=Micromonospora sp. NPDC005087 TaxID=3364225 RepID=UPI00367F1845